MVMWLSAPHTDIRRHGTGLSRRDFNDVIRNVGDCGGIVPFECTAEFVHSNAPGFPPPSRDESQPRYV